MPRWIEVPIQGSLVCYCLIIESHAMCENFMLMHAC